MWKYIVTWMIIRVVEVPCPQPEPYIDEFGRTPRITENLMIYCTKDDTTTLEKEFGKRQEAVDFMIRGQDRKNQGWPVLQNMGALAGFKLDSIKIAPKKK